MRIGIDARDILDPVREDGGGVARHTFALVTELIQKKDNTIILFLKKGYKSADLFNRKNVSIVWVQKNTIPFWSQHVTFSNIVNKQQLDIFHSPITSLPLFYSGKSIVTVHDLAIYMHPEWFPKGQWFSRKVLVPRSLKNASHILAVSDTTKSDVMSLFHIKSKKISVVYNMLPREQLFTDTQSIKTNPPQNPYLLFIGTIEPRKNLHTLFTAFLELKEDPAFSQYVLCIVGHEGWNMHDVFRKYSKEELTKRGVRFYDDINELEKREFLVHAKALVYPSLYEGFGLPIVEAQKAGTPVVTSNISSMPEVSGNGALFCDPRDPHDIKEKIARSITDASLKETLIQKGYDNVKRFESSKILDTLVAVYNHIKNN